jgi:hypothetical protein
MLWFPDDDWPQVAVGMHFQSMESNSGFNAEGAEEQRSAEKRGSLRSSAALRPLR